MTDTSTTNYEFVLPEPGGSNDTWGVKINDNIVALDILLKQFQDAIEHACPTGAIQAFATQTADAGWLDADGSWYSKLEQPKLWAKIGDAFLDGETARANEFRVPDIRATFVRGLDAGKGIDVGRVFGSIQLDAFQGHDHTFTGYSYGTTNDVSITDDGTIDGKWTSNPVGAPNTLTGYGSVRYANETRPRNIALYYRIKT
jgi:phage-related tail fiber protein